MTELARGRVGDRPWGRTLGALGTRGLTGQLTLTESGMSYRIAFQQGGVVGAASPLAADAAVRLALTGGLVTSTQVADITRKIAANSNRDEVDVVAEAAKLAPDQATKLRRRLVAQRAARTFSVEQGEFFVEDSIDIAVVPGSELDIRAVIYFGARSNLAEERLAAEVERLGGWFKLTAAAVNDLPQFGFTANDKPVLQQLATGASLDDLERDAPSNVGVRGVQAIVYALVSCNACEVGPSRPRRPTSVPPPAAMARTSSPQLPVVQRAPSASGPVVQRAPSTSQSGPLPRASSPQLPVRPKTASVAPPPNTPMTITRQIPTVPRTMSPSQTTGPVPLVPAAPAAPRTTSPSQTGPLPLAQSRTTSPSQTGPILARTSSQSGAHLRPHSPTGTGPHVARTSTPTAPQVARTPSTQLKGSQETEALIRDRLGLLERGADHFVLLGIAQDASPDVTRAAYFTLARKLHPDRIASLGITELRRDAQRLFAQINAAFAVLGDPAKRAAYVEVLGRGGESAVRAEEAKAGEVALRAMHAEEAFRRGEMALRREQLDQALVEFTTAIEMQPNEPEYQAMLAWTKFAAATDKAPIAHETRQKLGRAAEQSKTSLTARFYLGRVERILGRDRDALSHFQEVLRQKPNHAAASSEVRVIEARLASNKKKRE